MTDNILAFLALATFIGFLAVVVWFVPDFSLIVVIAFVSLLAAYDFWRSLRNNRP